MDFTLPAEVEQTRQKIADFVASRIMPLEDDRNSYDPHENLREDLLHSLRAEAQSEGLWALSMPPERGGRGFDGVGMAACYEEMNRSIFGPVVFNAAAPDDGNMYLLNRVARENQKDRWLQPIIDGEVRSSIVMTEPAPGAGSDPAGAMRTRAERRGDSWVVHGHKWFITGAEGASHFILLARTSDEPRRNLTTFLFHRDDPNWELVRRIPVMGPEEHGGHCELRFDGLEIPDENRLMEVGEGMKCVQIRLGMARLSHCMRWLGLSKRCLEIASVYVKDRIAFGRRLSERETIQDALGRVAMEIDIGRLLTMRAAWKLAQGDQARPEVSMAKIYVADLLHRAADVSIQLCGARGYSRDTPLEWIYRYARQARILDGASEVHAMLLSRIYFEKGRDFWSWGLGAGSKAPE